MPYKQFFRDSDWYKQIKLGEERQAIATDEQPREFVTGQALDKIYDMLGIQPFAPRSEGGDIRPVGREEFERGRNWSELTAGFREFDPRWNPEATQDWVVMAASLGIPSGTAVRAALPTTGRAAKIASAFLKPVQVAEQLPGTIAKEVLKEAGKGLQPVSRPVAAYARKLMPDLPERLPRPLSYDQLVAGIKAAKPARALSEQEKKKVFAPKLQEYTTEFLEGEDAIQALARGRQKLAGSLGDTHFQLPEDVKLTQEGLNELANYVRFTETKPLRAGNTVAALVKIWNGEIPQPHEFRYIQRIFPELADALEPHMKPGAWSYIADVLNLPRGLIASVDASAMARQGFFMGARHPKMAAKSMVNMLKATYSEKNIALIEQDIFAREHTEELLRFVPDILAVMAKGPRIGLTRYEENFISRWATKLFPHVRWSERAYVTYLNDMRSRVWENAFRNLEKANAPESEYKLMAKLIAASSGRGIVPESIKGTMPTLAGIFFSPRYQISRFQFPYYAIRALRHPNSPVAKEAWGQILSGLGVGTGVLSLMQMTGIGRVGLDPRSSDFGKLIIGNTRIDMWTGYAQYMRFLVQFFGGQRMTLQGKLQKVDPRWIGARFAQSKLSPAAGLFLDMLVGRTYVGEELRPESKVVLAQSWRRLAPLFVQDMIDALVIDGLEGGLAAIPAFFGAGVYTSEENWPYRTPRKGERKIRTTK